MALYFAPLALQNVLEQKGERILKRKNDMLFLAELHRACATHSATGATALGTHHCCHWNSNLRELAHSSDSSRNTVDGCHGNGCGCELMVGKAAHLERLKWKWLLFLRGEEPSL
jgi:hypothetical protein